MTKEEEPVWLGTLWNVDQSLAKQAEKYLEDEKKSDFEFLDKMAVENEKKNQRIRGLEKQLTVMNSLCRLAYGNLDKDVFSEIEKTEQLLNQKQL